MLTAQRARPGLLVLVVSVWLEASPGLAAGPEVPPELRTRAETSLFRATSTHAETLDYLRLLQARSPHIQLGSFGTSEQGRPMPFVVVSKDGAFTPEAARRLSKPIVLLQGGIHAGEIDGKDALLMLLRDLVLGLRPAVLDRVTLLVVPIYNVDGHERVSRFNRSNQDGPEDGMGFRTNARGLDLNRDHLKLDSAEARALIALFNAWRPHLHVDNHVSDGFDHAWVVGYATAEAPQAAPSIDAWVKATLPAVAEATRGAGHPIGPYLELLSSEEPLKGAITPPYRPRYSTGSFALRNRPSILIETHSHKPFRTRVLGNHAWLGALVEQVAKEPGAPVEAVAAAEKRTVTLGAADAPASDVALRYGPDRDDPAAGGGAERLSEPRFASRPYQGTMPVTSVRVSRALESRRLPAGSLWVPADQPDFEVAVQLLEADAPDSLVAWGFLSSVFERREWIDGQELEALAREGLQDPMRAAAWEAALRDPAFAGDPEARSEWWARQTPYWDETIGLLPVYRVLRPLPRP
jgi:hypothetical protein